MGDITRWVQSESPSLKEHDVPDIELKDDGKCHVVSDEGQLFPDPHYQTDVLTSFTKSSCICYRVHTENRKTQENGLITSIGMVESPSRHSQPFSDPCIRDPLFTGRILTILLKYSFPLTENVSLHEDK